MIDLITNKKVAQYKAFAAFPSSAGRSDPHTQGSLRLRGVEPLKELRVLRVLRGVVDAQRPHRSLVLIRHPGPVEPNPLNRLRPTRTQDIRLRLLGFPDASEGGWRTLSARTSLRCVAEAFVSCLLPPAGTVHSRSQIPDA